MKKLFFISLLMFSTFSFSAEWTLVTTSSDNEKYFIDSKSIKTNNQKGTAQAWIKTVKRYNGKDLMNSKFLMEYDCRNQKHRYLSLTQYNSKGIVKSSSSKEDYNFRYVAPDTIAESLMLFSCRTNKLIDAYNESGLTDDNR
ncbi:hypothetical protein AS4_28620 [Acinetobacter guillouiae]|uniref:surface-adhesin E family protein n=1 Tax=Acinetobacter guillouiae TaxID=106649 RepID=UPI0004EF6882|nr:surface-adhesin E family protein [Acinetobacter guillouiae]BAP37802.1 hypothetical protein AS4_28620 [Acinetobacter guillouiae]